MTKPDPAALRMSKEMKLCKRVTLRGAGHLPLDSRVNVTALMCDSAIMPQQLRRDRVRDFVPPAPAEMASASESLNGYRRLTSPVFFSTDPVTCQTVSGLSGLPKHTKGGRPILFVGNHQLWLVTL